MDPDFQLVQHCVRECHLFVNFQLSRLSGCKYLLPDYVTLILLHRGRLEPTGQIPHRASTRVQPQSQGRL